MKPLTTVITKKKRGPAPTGKGTLIGVRLQPDMLDPVDAFAAREPDNPSRPEALRRIIRDWLVAHGYIAVQGDK